MAATKKPHLLVKKPTDRAKKMQNAAAGINVTKEQQQYFFESSQPANRFIITEHFSLTPNSLAIYNRFHLRDNRMFTKDSVNTSPSATPEQVEAAAAAKKPRNSIAHNFELSKQARKNLRSKVTWLYHFAKKQTIVTRKGKQLTNLKMNFFTLKLPSVQVDSSDFITKNCLNQLFIEIKEKVNFKNYVWRLEYQKNGNLHYHIATDCYIDYDYLLATWNRIINKYGYVDAYTRKFSTFSLHDYIKNVGALDSADYKIHQERYAKGCRDKWKKPNTVDVRAVFGKSNIAFYISKYMAKKPEEGVQIILPACEDNSAHSRLWYCSRSLSKCKTVSDFRDVEEIDLYSVLRGLDKVRVSIFDYCIVLYFQIDELPPIVRRLLLTRLEVYQKEIGYLAAA